MIFFKKVRWKNLLSTGNVFTEVDLSENASTLIVGDNGAGKSTFLEAISFVLYGKAFRNINKPSLINSINQKGLLVEIEFSIGKKEYVIRRGMKPNLFEIIVDDQLINQEAASRDYQEVLERNILRLSHKSFKQIVTLGSSSFVPFMQLPSSQRREFIEDLLDIQIFSTMNILLKNRIQENKDNLAMIETQIALAQQKISLSEKHVASLKQNSEELIKSRKKEIKEHQKTVDELNETIDKANAKIEKYQPFVEHQEKYKNRYEEIRSLLFDLRFKHGELVKHISFFEDHDSCPTCTQNIDSLVKENNLKTQTTKNEEYIKAIAELETKEQSYKEKLDIIHQYIEKISNCRGVVLESLNGIKLYTTYISKLEREIENLRTDTDSFEKNDMNLAQARKEHSGLEKTKENLINERSLLGTASLLLKDGGIKTQIIKQYIPIMNKLINKYLAAMDFFVEFELDENFEEKIKSRFRDEFTYSSFSEGEKQRINLALLFAWRAVSKIKNSASTNLLIFDETLDSSMDTTGVEEFLKILETFAADTNIFIISHKGDALQDRFTNTLKFEKVKNFSTMVKV